MHRLTMARALLLAVPLLATLGWSPAFATPADGFRNQQDYAYATFATQLDECRHVDAWLGLVAGDLLKNPISGGAPMPWSDVTVQMWFRDDCADVVTELIGSVGAPPDITRLASASVGPFELTIRDATGEYELDVSGAVDWTRSGPALTIIENDASTGHFRADRRAPANATGALSLTDADGDLWPGGFELPQATIVDGRIGWANEIILCC